MKTSKKLLSVLLALVMVVSMMSMSAMAADTWSSITDGTTTVSVSTTTEKLVISGSNGSYAITSTESGYFPQNFSMQISNPNGEKISAASGYAFTAVAGKTYQIITQNGTEAPYITVLKCA